MGKKKKNILVVTGAVVLVGTGIFFARSAKAPESTVSTAAVNPPAGVPAVDPESIGKIIKDGKTGKEFVSNQVIVEFLPSVSEQDSLDAISRVGGKMLQRFTQAPLFLIQVKDSGDGTGAASAVAKLSADPLVKKADLNYLTTAKDTPAK